MTAGTVEELNAPYRISDRKRPTRDLSCEISDDKLVCVCQGDIKGEGAVPKPSPTQPIPHNLLTQNRKI